MISGSLAKGSVDINLIKAERADKTAADNCELLVYVKKKLE